MRLQKNGSALLALVAMGCALSSSVAAVPRRMLPSTTNQSSSADTSLAFAAILLTVLTAAFELTELAIRTFGPLLAARGHGGPANAANAVVPINAAAVDVENVSAGPADAVADAV